MDKPQVTICEIDEAPNLEELKKTFKVDENNLIISYGDRIFVKGKRLSPDLLVHELTHCDRQGFKEDTAKRWWERYMREVQFRLEEEVIAYKNQYEYCLKVYKDRNKQAKILWSLAGHLAGSQYGNLISHSDAMLLINSSNKV